MDPKAIRKRIEDLKARRLPAADMPYENAAALWEIAFQLHQLRNDLGGK